MHFTEEQQLRIATLIEKRLERERRAHQRQLSAERERAAAEIATLRSELRQVQTTRGILERLLGRWL